MENSKATQADFYICVPVWGQQYRKAFDPSYRSWKEALGNLKAKFLIHADKSLDIDEDVTYYPVPSGGDLYQRYAAAQKDAISKCPDGANILLLCADTVVSREAFQVVKQRLAEGKKLVMAASTRTLGKVPPVGVDARTLLKFVFENLHPVVEHCVLGSGKAKYPTVIYFRDGKALAMRAFHLHPLGFVKDRKIDIAHTPDESLPMAFSESETYIVTEPELAIAEMSPPDKAIGVADTPFDAERVASWARRKASSRHKWYFSHRIKLHGDYQSESDNEFQRAVWGLATG